MTFLMLVGSMCFSIFMVLCIDGMRVFAMSRKRSLLLLLLVSVLIIAFNIVAVLFLQLGAPVRLLLILCVFVVLLIVVYKSLPKALMLVVYITALVFGLDGVTMLSLRMLGYDPAPIWDVNTDWIATQNWVAVLVFIAVALGMWLLSVLLKNFLKKRIDMNIFNNRIMPFMLISAGVAVVFIYVSTASETPSITLGQWTLSFGDIAYLLFFITSVIMFAVILHYVSRETALRAEMLLVDSSKKYIHDLEESYRALRSIKHDYVNILSSFKLYIDNKDMEGLAKYYTDELAEMNRELLYQDQLMDSLHNVWVSEIKGILIFKCSVAAQHEIDTSIEVREPIERVGVSSAIVCQILGILLDNAIEAILEADEKKLYLTIVRNPNSKVFIIKNTWVKQDIPLDKLFDPGFSTKAESRGVGLPTVRRYTERIKGLYLETELTDRHFTQILTIEDC